MVLCSHPHRTPGENMALTRHTSFGNVMSLLFIMCSRFVIAFLARKQRLLISWHRLIWGFPHSSVGKESACSAGDVASIPGSGRSPGEGNGNPLQYSCLENLMDREAWEATAHGVTRVGHDLVTKPPPPPSWLLPPSTVILEKKIKSSIVSTFSSSVCHEVLGPDAMS